MKYVVLDLEMCYVPNSAVLRDYRYQPVITMILMTLSHFVDKCHIIRQPFTSFEQFLVVSFVDVIHPADKF